MQFLLCLESKTQIFSCLEICPTFAKLYFILFRDETNTHVNNPSLAKKMSISCTSMFFLSIHNLSTILHWPYKYKIQWTAIFGGTKSALWHKTDPQVQFRLLCVRPSTGLSRAICHFLRPFALRARPMQGLVTYVSPKHFLCSYLYACVYLSLHSSHVLITSGAQSP